MGKYFSLNRPTMHLNNPLLFIFIFIFCLLIPSSFSNLDKNTFLKPNAKQKKYKTFKMKVSDFGHTLINKNSVNLTKNICKKGFHWYNDQCIHNDRYCTVYNKKNYSCEYCNFPWWLETNKENGNYCINRWYYYVLISIAVILGAFILFEFVQVCISCFSGSKKNYVELE